MVKGGVSVWWEIQLLSPGLLCLPQVVVVLDAKSCLTLVSLLGSSVHGISQASIGDAFSFSRTSS